MAETILSYLLAEESSNPQMISKKMGVWESGEDGISLISLGRDGEWDKVAITTVHFPEGNSSGDLGEFGSKVPKQGKKLSSSRSGYRSEGVNRARSGGIDQGKPVFGTFKGERRLR